jgi:sugar phosphate isomerase/epimerase
MKEINLVHFIEWKKIPDNELDATMKALSSIGANNIVLHPEWAKRNQADRGYLKMIGAKMKNFGISSTATHGLWGNEFDLRCPDEERRKEIVRAHREFIEISAAMGSLTYTVHLGDDQAGQTRQEMQGRARKCIDELLPVAENTGTKIAMENMISYDHSEYLAALAAEYDNPSLGLCLDTGHAHVKEGLKKAVDNMAPYLVTCHLHDNDGNGDQHYPPTRGSIDWKYLVPTLKACPKILNAETEAGSCEDLSISANWELFENTWAEPK